MNISEQILSTPESLRQLERLHQRPSDSVLLVAVTKGQPISSILTAINAGINDLAENYLQEALPKIQALGSYPLHWHFIGPIQSNKVKAIAQYFSWVHSLSSLSIAEKLNAARKSKLPRLNVCIQVKLHEDSNKSGINPDYLAQLADEINHLPYLCLRGLMIIGRQQSSTNMQMLDFKRAKHLLETINQSLGLHLDTLSMGMSNDYELAIAAGSTLVRLGKVLFGPRTQN